MLLHAAATGHLAEAPDLRWHDDAAVTVVVAAHGYPGEVRSGDRITGLEAADAVEGVHVLHAGTRRDRKGRLVTSGGRVLSVVGTGADLDAARAAAYAGVAEIAARRRAAPQRHRRRSHRLNPRWRTG